MFTTNVNTMNTFGDYLFIAGMYQKISAIQGQNVLPTEMYVLESYYCGSGIGRDAADNGQAQTNNADGNRTSLKLSGRTARSVQLPFMNPMLQNHHPLVTFKSEIMHF